VVRNCERQLSINSEAECQLCRTKLSSLTQLRRHLGKHHQELALFALPSSLEQNDDERSNEKGSECSDTRSNQSDSLEPNEEPMPHDTHYSNALQAASAQGYKAVVRLLLDKGADVNVQCGQYGNALQAASYGGHEAVVRLLLSKDADVNAQGGMYGNALQAASAGGHEHEAVVRLLLDKDADVNAQGGHYGNALQAASAKGHKAVVRLLLDKDADVNAQGGYYYNNAL
jgi:ankyrin repeat protein